MSFVKNIGIGLTLALVGLFSSTANAELRGDQLIPMTDRALAQAMQSQNAAFNQCVREKFVMEKPEDKPPLLGRLYEGMVARIAAGLVDDEKTFEISVNSILKKNCGSNQLAGDGKDSK